MVNFIYSLFKNLSEYHIFRKVGFSYPAAMNHNLLDDINLEEGNRYATEGQIAGRYLSIP